MHKSAVFSILTELCNHHHRLISEHFITPKRNIIGNHLPPPTSLRQPLIIPIPVVFPVLDFFTNHTICDVLCLDSFI